MAFHHTYYNIPENIRNLCSWAEWVAHTLVYQPNVPSECYLMTELGDYPYKIQRVNTEHRALLCYLLIPQCEQDTDLKIVFRGTKDLASMIRDLEQPSTNHDSFQQSQDLILSALNEALQTTHLAKAKQVSLSISGHSLGARDAKECMAALLRAMAAWTEKNLIHHSTYHLHQLSKIRLLIFNPAGMVSSDVAAQAAQHATTLSQQGVQLETYWTIAPGDVVHQTGSVNIFLDLPDSVIKNHLIIAYHKKILETSWQSSFNPLQLLDAARASITAHTSHFYNVQKNAIAKYSYHNNINLDEFINIKDVFLEKNLLLQSRILKIVQFLLEAILISYHRLTVGTLTTKLEQESMEPFIDVYKEYVEQMNALATFNRNEPFILTLPSELTEIFAHTPFLSSALVPLQQTKSNKTPINLIITPNAARTILETLQLPIEQISPWSHQNALPAASTAALTDITHLTDSDQIFLTAIEEALRLLNQQKTAIDQWENTYKYKTLLQNTFAHLIKEFDTQKKKLQQGEDNKAHVQNHLVQAIDNSLINNPELGKHRNHFAMFGRILLNVLFILPIIGQIIHFAFKKQIEKTTLNRSAYFFSLNTRREQIISAAKMAITEPEEATSIVNHVLGNHLNPIKVR